jgi:hypothetical protein
MSDYNQFSSEMASIRKRLAALNNAVLNEGTSRTFLFVTGCPRSGTTAIGDLLNTHPGIVLGIERFILRAFNNPGFSLEPSLYEHDRFFEIRPKDTFYDDLEGFYAGYREMRTKYHRSRYIGDKLPNLYQSMERFQKVFPSNAKIVIIFRNIFHVAASYIRRARNLDDHFWRRDQDLRVALSDWQEAMTFLEDERDNPNVIPLCYEDFFTDIRYLHNLLDDLGLPSSTSIEDCYNGLKEQFTALDSAGRLSLSPADVVEIIEKAPLEKYNIARELFLARNQIKAA